MPLRDISQGHFVWYALVKQMPQHIVNSQCSENSCLWAASRLQANEKFAPTPLTIRTDQLQTLPPSLFVQ